MSDDHELGHEARMIVFNLKKEQLEAEQLRRERDQVAKDELWKKKWYVRLTRWAISLFRR